MGIDRMVQFAVQQKASTTFSNPSQIEKFFKRLEAWKKINDAKKSKAVVPSPTISK